MTQALYTVDEVSVMIREGKKLLLAGDAKLLSQLPKGDWIGGTTPYFILYPEKLVESHEKLFVNCLPDFVETTEIREYDSESIKNIYNDAPQNGLTILIIPFSSPVHIEFAVNVPGYENFAGYPLCGWIAGQPLDIIMTEKSYVRSGASGILTSNLAVAMHVSLPGNKFAEIHTFNQYEPSNGDVITFEYNGMIVEDAVINGVKQNFADYLSGININIGDIPLVANYSGAMVITNCSDVKDNRVYMAAPVFEHIEYRFAVRKAEVSEPKTTGNVVFSTTCASNYLRPELCKRLIKNVNGPAVFGEIAYQMLNEATLYIAIGDVPLDNEININYHNLLQ